MVHRPETIGPEAIEPASDANQASQPWWTEVVLVARYGGSAVAAVAMFIGLYIALLEVLTGRMKDPKYAALITVVVVVLLLFLAALSRVVALSAASAKARATATRSESDRRRLEAQRDDALQRQVSAEAKVEAFSRRAWELQNIISPEGLLRTLGVFHRQILGTAEYAASRRAWAERTVRVLRASMAQDASGAVTIAACINAGADQGAAPGLAIAVSANGAVLATGVLTETMEADECSAILTPVDGKDALWQEVANDCVLVGEYVPAGWMVTLAEQQASIAGEYLTGLLQKVDDLSTCLRRTLAGGSDE